MQNIDIDGSEFRNKKRQLSIKDKIYLTWMSLLLYFPFALNTNKIIHIFKSMYAYPKNEEYKMKNPLSHYAFTHREKSSLKLLIENDRNIKIQEKLQDVINGNRDREFRYDIGILFGDGHMLHIYQTLSKNNFKWKLYKEVIVI